MSQDIYDLIVVGAGIAGLACANTIVEKNNSIKMKIISPQVGGKLIASENKLFNYGPYFIRDDYQHVSKYFIKKSKITWRDFMFHDGNKYYPFDLRFLKYAFDHLSFKNELNKFYKEFQELRKQCFQKPQSVAIQENSYLYSLYQQNGSDFILQHSNKNYFEKYISYILKAVSFSSPNKMNAFHMLSLLLSININSYRYEFDAAGLFKNVSKHYLQDTVDEIQQLDGGLYQVNTSNSSSFKSKRVVVAASTDLSRYLVKSIKHQPINQPNSVQVFHCRGNVKKQFMMRRTNIFDDNDEIFVLDSSETDKNEYMVYANTHAPMLENIFNHYTIIKQFAWDNCFHFNGSKLMELEREENLYFIGDHNIVFMEDVFIYGCYMGDLIVKNI